jgi:hypothetical protein
MPVTMSIKIWFCTSSLAHSPIPYTNISFVPYHPLQHTNNGGRRLSINSGSMFIWGTEQTALKQKPNHHPQILGNHSGSREGGIPRGPVQKDGSRKVLTCFFCGKPGHFAQDCRQKQYGNQGPPRTYPGQPHGNQPVIRARQTPEEGGVAEDKTPQQWATGWLSGVTNEEDDVKDIIMQELMGREDFQNAWTQQPGWGLFVVTPCTLLATVLCMFQYWFAQVTSWPTRKHW